MINSDSQNNSSRATLHTPYKVCAVVVTFNRRTLLEGTLRCLAEQTFPIDEILVVNNASTDGTKEFLGNLRKPAVTVIHMTKNLGGAGGFSAGIEAAFRKGSDLIWVMDDDVLPRADALEKLTQSLTGLREKGNSPNFLICNVFNSDGEPVNAPVVDLRIQKNGNLRLTTFLSDRLLPVVSASFVGTLITREAVARYGLPIAEMFIWGDDTEYTFRLTADREAGYVVGDSKMVHLGRGTELSLLTENDMNRAEKFFYFYRNNVYVLRKFGSKQKVASFCLAGLRLFFRLLLRGEMRKLAILLKGVGSGLVFNPAIRMVN